MSYEYILLIIGLIVKSFMEIYEKIIGKMSNVVFVILTIISLIFIVIGLIKIFKDFYNNKKSRY